MSRDHKIRVLVAGLKGPAREQEIMRLLTTPSLINPRLTTRIHMIRKLHERTASSQN